MSEANIRKMIRYALIKLIEEGKLKGELYVEKLPGYKDAIALYTKEGKAKSPPEYLLAIIWDA